MTDEEPEHLGDDAPGRRRRAERLRAKIDALRGGDRAPPRTPREFADRAASEQAEAARDRADDPD
jgi:hypothetical protein